MSVDDITPDAVLNAIKNGSDSIYALAEHFDVASTANRLCRTVNKLSHDGLITLTNSVEHDDYQLAVK